MESELLKVGANVDIQRTDGTFSAVHWCTVVEVARLLEDEDESF